MSIVVMKFGGTSVADIDRIRNVACHVKREHDAGNQVAVIVSAMAGRTNELVAWTREAAPMHDAREYDTVVAAGEQITAGLLAICLQNLGVDARSWMGWQIPLQTNNAHGAARIAIPEADQFLNVCGQCRVAIHIVVRHLECLTGAALDFHGILKLIHGVHILRNETIEAASFVERPRRVLIIGYGTGSMTETVLRMDGVEQVVVIALEAVHSWSCAL